MPYDNRLWGLGSSPLSETEVQTIRSAPRDFTVSPPISINELAAMNEKDQLSMWDRAHHTLQVMDDAAVERWDRAKGAEPSEPTAKVKPQDDIARPHHYARYAIEPITFIMANNLPFCVGNVVKYVLRYDAKNGLEDLKKARRYIDMMIEQIGREGKGTVGDAKGKPL